MNPDFCDRNDERSSLLESRSKYLSAPFELSDDFVEKSYSNKELAKGWSLNAKRAVAVASLCAVLLLAYKTLPSASKKLVSEVAKPSLDTSNTYPNIVFFLVDDLGWNSLGTYYDLHFTTPNINELISKGIMIQNYYTQEICTPARASLMTGRYPIHLGMQYGEISGMSTLALPLMETTLPQVLKTVGYTNYALGKWNLGHRSAQYLPTARGFDQHLGYMDGGNFYWSKIDPSLTSYTDFTYATTECYYQYEGDDIYDYSTELYTNKALNVIKTHNYDSGPMFLYMAYQAAHVPFEDTNHTNGVDADYIGVRYNVTVDRVVGGERQQVGMSMMLVDDSVKKIVQELTNVGQLDNTYIVITSDNGGCYASGGKNGPLRGSKGTLFEGGTKVNAYMYSPLLPESTSGKNYTGLFHISDWFPTLLGFAGITYDAPEGYELDGVDQSKAMIYSTTETVAFPRSSLLYNMYLNVSGKTFDLDSNAPVAIRDSRYKLLHAYNGVPQAETYYPTDEVVNDDSLADFSSCSPIFKGTYTKFLFDLVNDPYETNNLYGNPEYSEVKEALYRMLDDFSVMTEPSDYKCSLTSNKAYLCTTVWDDRGYVVQPWNSTVDADASSSVYPNYCNPTDSVFINQA